MDQKKKDIERRVLIAGIGGAVAGSLLVGGRARAGNLNPPGAPAPSGKSTSELASMIARTDLGCAMPAIPVESLPGTASCKHLITASGSYYLAGNIQGNPGQNVIEIRASHVDLCGGGFHIFVPANPVGLPAGIGVYCDGENVTFYDGSVIGGSVGVDFGLATRFILWDVISIGAAVCGMQLGSEGNLYDSESHNSPGTGFLAMGSHTLIEEGAAFSCATGFACTGAQNLFLCNFATNCQTPFAIGQGNSYGPIVSVVGVGDISGTPGGNHPGANIVY